MPNGPLPCSGYNLLASVFLIGCTTCFVASVIVNDWGRYNYDAAATDPTDGSILYNSDNSTRVSNYDYREGLWRSCTRQCLRGTLTPADLVAPWDNGCTEWDCEKLTHDEVSYTFRAVRGFAITTCILSFLATLTVLMGCWDGYDKPTHKLTGHLAVLTGIFALITWAIYIGQWNHLNHDDWTDSFLQFRPCVGAFIGAGVFAWFAAALARAAGKDQNNDHEPVNQN